MAHLNWHGKIIKTWFRELDNVRYHLTETGWLIKTTGPRLGGAKIIARPMQLEEKEKYFTLLSNDWTLLQNVLR